MIAFLRGSLISRTLQYVVIDVNGVGYQVFMSSVAAEGLGPIGSEVVVYTYMQVSDSGIALYGFKDEQEKTVFEKLITVSGVGPKVAISALSSYSAADLVNLIAAQDVAKMSKVPGIGKKTAQRILIDLKDAFAGFGPSLLSPYGEEADDSPIQSNDAVEALLAMGFSSEEAQLAVKGYTGPVDTQSIIRFALKRLGGF